MTDAIQTVCDGRLESATEVKTAMGTQGGELEGLKGQFVAICAKEMLVLGPFETYAEAIQAGRKQCKSDEFVVMRLLPVKPPKDAA